MEKTEEEEEDMEREREDMFVFFNGFSVFP